MHDPGCPGDDALDVYKRQGETVYKRDGDISIEQQALAGIGVRDIGELMLGNAELLCQDRTVALRPVSYTHLDVYKRQGWRSD